MATAVPGGRTPRAASLSGESTTIGRAPAFAAASTDQSSSGLPAQRCRTFGTFERMRVPSPAARTMAQVGWSGALIWSFGEVRDQRAGWGARSRTWGRGSKVLCLTTWPRPTDGTLGCWAWRKSRCALRCGLTVRAWRPFSTLDELSDAPATLAPELGVPLTAELALAGFPTTTAELRVTLAAELTLAGLAALAPEVGIASGTELLLPRLAATAADLAVELRPVLRGRELPALPPGRPHGHVTFVVFLPPFSATGHPPPPAPSTPTPPACHH